MVMKLWGDTRFLEPMSKTSCFAYWFNVSINCFKQ